MLVLSICALRLATSGWSMYVEHHIFSRGKRTYVAGVLDFCTLHNHNCPPSRFGLKMSLLLDCDDLAVVAVA